MLSKIRQLSDTLKFPAVDISSNAFHTRDLFYLKTGVKTVKNWG